MDNSETAMCDECKSDFNRNISKMSSLCPECANALYGSKNCEHQFKNGKCLKCFWDGSISKYVKDLKQEN